MVWCGPCSAVVLRSGAGARNHIGITQSPCMEQSYCGGRKLYENHQLQMHSEALESGDNHKQEMSIELKSAVESVLM